MSLVKAMCGVELRFCQAVCVRLKRHIMAIVAMPPLAMPPLAMPPHAVLLLP